MDTCDSENWVPDLYSGGMDLIMIDYNVDHDSLNDICNDLYQEGIAMGSHHVMASAICRGIDPGDVHGTHDFCVKCLRDHFTFFDGCQPIELVRALHVPHSMFREEIISCSLSLFLQVSPLPPTVVLCCP